MGWNLLGVGCLVSSQALVAAMYWHSTDQHVNEQVSWRKRNGHEKKGAMWATPKAHNLGFDSTFLLYIYIYIIYNYIYITYCIIHIYIYVYVCCYSHTYCSSWLNNGDSHDITGIDEIEWGVDGRSTMILPGMYMTDTPWSENPNFIVSFHVWKDHIDTSLLAKLYWDPPVSGQFKILMVSHLAVQTGTPALTWLIPDGIMNLGFCVWKNLIYVQRIHQVTMNINNVNHTLW